MAAPAWLLIAIALQTTPSGGAIARFVPPVPTPASFIADERAVLKPAERAALDARITAIQSAGLGDIAVAILPSIGSYSPNQVSVEIYRTWKVGSVAAIGSARRNVGVLLLIVPKELAPDKRGQCWINTGTGAEGIITDAMAGAICRDSIIPYLRTQDYAGAVGAGIGGIEARLRGDSALVNSAPASGDALRLLGDDSDPGTSRAPFVFGGLAALILGVFGTRRWLRYRQRNCPRCGERMQLLDEKKDDLVLAEGERLEEKLGSVDHDAWQCQCGERTVIPYRTVFTKYKECKSCHRRTVTAKRVTITSATTSHRGLAQDRYRCKACKHAWVVEVVLPEISTSSSSGGGSSGGGGGGSSFGGSGSSSGGGGGSSY